jgi:hypothetical protein
MCCIDHSLNGPPQQFQRCQSEPPVSGEVGAEIVAIGFREYISDLVDHQRCPGG